MRVLAIIPCHNEELTIAETILDLKNGYPDIEIWVVDNASTDSTVAVATGLGVRVLRCPILGKGFAMREAFSKVDSKRYDAIFMTDGDHTYGVESLNIAFKHVVDDGFDMVIGKRVLNSDSNLERTKSYRRGHHSGNQLLTATFRILFGINIPDTLSGWRCFSPGFISSFTGGASGFELETELNAHIYLISGSVISIPVSYRGRIYGSNSKLNTFKDGLKILRRLLFLFRTERPLFAYSSLGVPWMILSIVLMRNVLVNYFELQMIPNFPSLIAGVGSFTASILLWTTGMLLANQRLTRAALARLAYTEGSNGHYK